MKNLIFIIAITLSSSIAMAQQCSRFYPLEEGVKLEYTTYDRKGKPAAIMNSTVTDVRSEGGKQVATMKSDMKDEKGKDMTEMSYDVYCEGSKLSIDFKSMLNSTLMDQYKDMEVTVKGTNVDLPSDLSVGDDLPDANMEMSISMAGMPMKMTTEIVDRKVIGNESITTPAGTFNCYVITYTTNIKMGMNRSSTAKQWISEGVGMVKQEDYNNGGKVMNSTVLTAFSK